MLLKRIFLSQRIGNQQILILISILMQFPFNFAHFLTNENLGGADWLMYVQRTKSILDGNFLVMPGMAANNFIPGFTAPPLINYFFIPTSLFNYSGLSFEVLFMFFNVLNVQLFYKISVLSDINEKQALRYSLIFILSPFFLMSSSFLVSDEPVVLFTMLLPLLFVREKPLLAIILLWFSFLSKFWVIFFIPTFFVFIVKNSGWSMEKVITVFFVVFLLMVIPFQIGFLYQFGSEGYSLPVHILDSEVHGISLQKILVNTLNFTVIDANTKVFLLGFYVVLVCLLNCLYYTKKMSFFSVLGYTMAIYFLMSFKVYIEYFILLIPFILWFFHFANTKGINQEKRIGIIVGVFSLTVMWGNYSYWNYNFGIEIYFALLVLLIIMTSELIAGSQKKSKKSL